MPSSPSDCVRWFGVDWSGAALPRSQRVFVAELHGDEGRREVIALTRAADRSAVARWLAGEAPLVPHRRWTALPAPSRLQATGATLIGLDFAFGFPATFADPQRGLPDGWHWRELLRWAATLVAAPPLDDRLREVGWFHLPGHRPRQSPDAHDRLRTTERAARGQGLPVTDVFNCTVPSQVGKGSIHGLALLDTLADAVAVWPFDAPDRADATRPVLAEVYPSQWSGRRSTAEQRRRRVEVWERAGLRWRTESLRRAALESRDALDAVAAAWGSSQAAAWPSPLPPEAAREGWILGVDPR